jgi:DNA polymerase-3 subunit epsilon
MAKDLHPGKRNSLDVLCDRYGIDNSGRTLHGALLDAELLADVYLAMTRGQDSLAIGIEPAGGGIRVAQVDVARLAAPLRVLTAVAEELAEHAAYLAALERETRRAPIWGTLIAAAEQSISPTPALA